MLYLAGCARERAALQIPEQGFQVGPGSFSYHFHASIPAIANPAYQVLVRGAALGEGAESHPLDSPGYPGV